MRKRFLSGFMVFLFVFAAITTLFPQKNLAYQSKAYYSSIKIGLKSMEAASMLLTLNGSYSLNGQTFPSDSSYTLNISNGRVTFNGTSYSSFTLTPSNNINTITIRSGNLTRKYLGSIQFKVVSGMILPINCLYIEDYLKGVVGSEMSNYFPIEALKAQAVAARNYTLINMGLYKNSGYDLTDSPDTQAYSGYHENYLNVIKAVNDTRGMVQLYNDSLVQAYYSASNGGYEEASENVWFYSFPYLKAKKDSFDNISWPYGGLTFTKDQIDYLLKAKGYILNTDKFLKIDLSTISHYASGRVSNIDIIYTNAQGKQVRKSFSKNSACTFLDFPSSMYVVSFNSASESYSFIGKGNGHGVGLSQLGAKSRAELGEVYTTILNFYYDGSHTESLLPYISNLTANKNSTIVGQPVSINAAAQGGSGSGYLYKYVVTKGGAVVLTQNYSEKSTFNYSPSLSGNYNINVYLLDKLSNQSYDESKSISITAYDGPTLKPMTLNKTEALIGQPINVSTSASGGSGLGYLYKFAVINNGTTVYTQDYSVKSTMNYTPVKAGNYTVSTFVRDNISTASYDSTSQASFTVYAPPQISYTTFTGTLFEKRPVTITAKSQLGSGNLPSFRFEVYNETALVASQSFSTASSFNFTPGSYGSYTVKVFVRDKTSSTYDNIKQYSLNIKKEPVSVSNLPIIFGMKGNNVLQLQNGLANLGYKLGKIDGVFGSKTFNAVVDFQKSKGIIGTGIVNKDTIKVINDVLIKKLTS